MILIKVTVQRGDIKAASNKEKLPPAEFEITFSGSEI